MQRRKLLSLGLVLGLVTSLVLPSNAELLKNFKADGSIEIRSFAIDNETDQNSATDDFRGETRTRVMVGGSFDLLDDVHSRVLLRKNNRVYGGGSENGNTVQSNILFDNAYVKVDKVFGSVDLTMGRQFYGDSNDLVIYFGPQPDDLLSVTAVDVFRADADLMGGWAKFQGIAGKIADTGAAGTNSDTDVYGGKIGTDKVIPKGNLSAAWYERRIKGAGVTANDDLQAANLALLGDLGDTGLGYRAEYVQNFGRNHALVPPAGGSNAYDGNAYFLGLRYGGTMSERPLRAMLEYGRGTSRYTEIAPGKRFGKIWGEHNNFGPGYPGLSNLNVIDAGVGINLNTKLGVDFNAYNFAADTPNAAGKSNYGQEYDLIVSWKHSDNVSFEVSAASFQLGDRLRNAPPTGSSPITRLGSDVKIKF